MNFYSKSKPKPNSGHVHWIVTTEVKYNVGSCEDKIKFTFCIYYYARRISREEQQNIQEKSFTKCVVGTKFTDCLYTPLSTLYKCALHVPTCYYM